MLLDLRSLVFATSIGLQIVGQVPTVQQDVVTVVVTDTGITPDAGSASLTGQAPLLDSGIIPSFGQLTGTGQVSVLGTGLIPDVGNLSFNGVASIVGSDIVITSPAGSLVLTGFRPGVTENNGTTERRRHFARGWTRV